MTKAQLLVKIAELERQIEILCALNRDQGIAIKHFIEARNRAEEKRRVQGRVA